MCQPYIGSTTTLSDIYKFLEGENIMWAVTHGIETFFTSLYMSLHYLLRILTSFLPILH